MSKENVKKEIIYYSIKKITILVILFIFICGMIICSACSNFSENSIMAYMAVFFYVGMFIIVIVASKFNLQKRLGEVISPDDYKHILEYVVDSTKDKKRSVFLWYGNGLYIIKRTFEQMVYYHMNMVNEDYFKDHLWYVQSLFTVPNKPLMISKEVQSKEYLGKICNSLLVQFEKKEFNRQELEQILWCNSMYKKQFVLTKEMFEIFFNIIMIIVLIVKLVITSNDFAYNQVNDNIILRFIYNTSADLVASSFAIMYFIKK